VDGTTTALAPGGELALAHLPTHVEIREAP
jgi:hypothetical protein